MALLCGILSLTIVRLHQVFQSTVFPFKPPAMSWRNPRWNAIMSSGVHSSCCQAKLILCHLFWALRGFLEADCVGWSWFIGVKGQEDLEGEQSKQTSIRNLASMVLGLRWWYEGPIRVPLWAGRCLVQVGHRGHFRKKGDDELQMQGREFWKSAKPLSSIWTVFERKREREIRLFWGWTGQPEKWRVLRQWNSHSFASVRKD